MMVGKSATSSIRCRSKSHCWTKLAATLGMFSFLRSCTSGDWVVTSVSESSGPQANRDPRWDFLRGVTLLIVLIDHIEDQTTVRVIRPWMPVSTCFFDGAEAFVFLSGMVFGLTYRRRLERDGLASSFRKAVRRSITIYLTYLLTVLSVLGIGILFGGQSPFLVERLRLDAGAERCLLSALAMRYQPWGFPILAVYAVTLPIMPFILFSWMRSPITGWIAPVGMYVAAQMIPELQLDRIPHGGEWTFNPFAWQFLFFIGIVVGTVNRPRDNTCSWSIRMILLAGALMIFVAGVLIRTERITWLVNSREVGIDVARFVSAWNDKCRLGPIRLLHFASLLVILSIVLPACTSKLWGRRVVGPVIECGQNSLLVYSFGVVMMYLSIPSLHLIGETTTSVLIADVDCCLLSIGLAYLPMICRQAISTNNPTSTASSKRPS